MRWQDGTQASRFCTSVSPEDLIELGGVQAADDLDAISTLWPADHDPGDLFRYVCAAGKDRG